MGLIGINIQIAHKEKLVPEFKMKSQSESKSVSKSDESNDIIAKTETEQVNIDEKKMEKLITLEEEEAKLK